MAYMRLQKCCYCSPFKIDFSYYEASSFDISINTPTKKKGVVIFLFEIMKYKNIIMLASTWCGKTYECHVIFSYIIPPLTAIPANKYNLQDYIYYHHNVEKFRLPYYAISNRNEIYVFIWNNLFLHNCIDMIINIYISFFFEAKFIDKIYVHGISSSKKKLLV